MTRVKLHKVTVERQDSLPEDDLREYIQIVSTAVNDNFRLFDGTEPYDVWTEVVTTSQVVVQNHSQGKYFRADYTMDEDKNVSFTNVIEVVRQYVPVETVERSGITTVEVAVPTMWGTVL